MIWPKRIWIADIGDLYLNNPNQKLPKWVSPLLRCFQSLVLNKSDYVILNSEEIFEHYKNNFQLNTLKTRVIYNGSLLNFVGLKSITNNFTNLSFIGNTYENVREGIKELQLILDTINFKFLKHFLSYCWYFFESLIMIDLKFGSLQY